VRIFRAASCHASSGFIAAGAFSPRLAGLSSVCEAKGTRPGSTRPVGRSRWFGVGLTSPPANLGSFVMSEANEFSFSLDDFGGVARLFPLPNLVLFPHVMQPLHIFEPRYREMLADALASDQLISLGLLKPGWESSYEGRPPVYPVSCLSRIVTSHQLANGSSNVLVMGLKRARQLRELQPSQSFRLLEVELLDDELPNESSTACRDLRRELYDVLHRVLPKHSLVAEQLKQLLQSEVSLEKLTDVVGYAASLGLEQKQRLLAEPRVLARGKLLLESLKETLDQQSADPSSVDYPPDFSSN
jgi:Lon protease-like protein